MYDDIYDVETAAIKKIATHINSAIFFEDVPFWSHTLDPLLFRLTEAFLEIFFLWRGGGGIASIVLDFFDVFNSSFLKS